MEEVGDKLDASLKSEVEADLNALKSTVAATAGVDELTDSQIQELKDGKEKLMKSAQALFTKMYEQQAQAQGAAGPDMGAAGASSAPNDDVVDADFKEV